MERKEQIRKSYRSIRNNMNALQVNTLSSGICRKLIETELFKNSDIIYFYYPLGNEVNLLEAAKEALYLGKTIAFPKTEGEEMRFFQVDSLTEFAEGTFHVMEPESQKLIEAQAPLILTPGLVFDAAKNRMGYGKGYYDKYVANFPGAIKIGIAYESQMAEQIPVDSYDIPMDYILTEERFW